MFRRSLQRMMEAGLKVSHLCCRYEDGGKVRPILHRASLVEMAVVSTPSRESYCLSGCGCEFQGRSISFGWVITCVPTSTL